MEARSAVLRFCTAARRALGQKSNTAQRSAIASPPKLMAESGFKARRPHKFLISYPLIALGFIIITSLSTHPKHPRPDNRPLNPSATNKTNAGCKQHLASSTKKC